MAATLANQVGVVAVNAARGGRTGYAAHGLKYDSEQRKRAVEHRLQQFLPRFIRGDDGS